MEGPPDATCPIETYLHSNGTGRQHAVDGRRGDDGSRRLTMAIDYQGPSDSVRYDAPSAATPGTNANAAQAMPAPGMQWAQSTPTPAQPTMCANGMPTSPWGPTPGVAETPYPQPTIIKLTAPVLQPGLYAYNSTQPAPQAEPGQAFPQAQQAQANPYVGAYVNMSAGTQASQQAWQQPGQQAVAYSPKSKTNAGILGIVLGALGAHNFYLGRIGRGVAQLSITMLSGGLLALFSGVWGAVEGICILASSPGDKWSKDGHGHELIS